MIAGQITNSFGVAQVIDRVVTRMKPEACFYVVLVSAGRVVRGWWLRVRELRFCRIWQASCDGKLFPTVTRNEEDEARLDAKSRRKQRINLVIKVSRGRKCKLVCLKPWLAEEVDGYTDDFVQTGKGPRSFFQRIDVVPKE